MLRLCIVLVGAPPAFFLLRARPLQERWNLMLPAGYCDEVAEAWRTGGWLGNVSGDEEAARLAATLVGNMTEAEKLRLVQGYGWNGWQGPAPGLRFLQY